MRNLVVFAVLAMLALPAAPLRAELAPEQPDLKLQQPEVQEPEARPKGPRAFIAQQPCDDPQNIYQNLAKYYEDPLFVGTANIRHVNGTFYASDIMFMVNQDTGTWTLMARYLDNTICIIAAGENFLPYDGPRRQRTVNP